MWHVVLFEVAIYVGIWRWITRRPAVPAKAMPLPYARMVTPVLWLFIWGSAIEVVAMDLIITHLGWRLVRIPVLLLGIWSVVWMLGMLASFRTRPHVLTETEVRLRSGLRGEIVLPVAAIVSVGRREAELSSSMKSIEVVEGALLVGVSGRTNLMLRLEGPTTIATPKGEVSVDEVGCWVDEPGDVQALLRARVPAEHT